MHVCQKGKENERTQCNHEMISFIKFIFVINTDKISKRNLLKKILTKTLGGFALTIISVTSFIAHTRLLSQLSENYSTEEKKVIKKSCCRLWLNTRAGFV